MFKHLTALMMAALIGVPWCCCLDSAVAASSADAVKSGETAPAQPHACCVEKAGSAGTGNGTSRDGGDGEPAPCQCAEHQPDAVAPVPISTPDFAGHQISEESWNIEDTFSRPSAAEGSLSFTRHHDWSDSSPPGGFASLWFGVYRL